MLGLLDFNTLKIVNVFLVPRNANSKRAAAAAERANTVSQSLTCRRHGPHGYVTGGGHFECTAASHGAAVSSTNLRAVGTRR